MRAFCFQLPFLIFSCFVIQSLEAKFSESELKEFLKKDYEREATEKCYIINTAYFDFETDVKNKEKVAKLTNVTLDNGAWEKDIWKKYFKDLNPNDYNDNYIKRQVNDLRILGISALSTEKLEQWTNLSNQLTEIYSSAKICPYSNQNCKLETEGLNLEPDIEEIMAKSTDYDELLYVWKSWRDATGAKMKSIYKTFVSLANEAAQANNFTDLGALWRRAYEDPNFVQNMDNLWNEVEPLYNELHRYVATRLKNRYGDKIDLSDGLIPAHVLGNMWAQSWNNLGDLVKPYPNASKVDVDKAFKDQGYTVMDMFRKAEDFYQSMGLEPMDMSYNESAGAMINKPTDGREVLCHASAWDFCDSKTFRLKMCTSINLEDFTTIHHELGHIQYYLLYKNQPFRFRDGANPGFHEAVGDTIALSVDTPTHLQKIKLLTNYSENYEADLNSLMNVALNKVAFLPFGLLIDKWRWDVFNGSVPDDKWNSHWWSYRQKYQKVKAPISRSDDHDFDPGAKYHVPGNSQYVAYFLAHILQFQFYRSLCITAGQYDPNTKEVPLFKCDFYHSKAAGDKLREALSLGKSKHWSEPLEILTGTKSISALPLLEYFAPLYEFLKKENAKEASLTTEKSATTGTKPVGPRTKPSVTQTTRKQ